MVGFAHERRRPESVVSAMVDVVAIYNWRASEGEDD